MIVDPHLRELVHQTSPFRPGHDPRDPANQPRKPGRPKSPPAAPAPPPQPVTVPPSRLAVDRHPQRQKIIDSLLAGQSARAVSRWTDPHLCHEAVAKFARKVLRPALRRADAVAIAVQQTAPHASADIVAPAPAKTRTTSPESLLSHDDSESDTSLTTALTRTILAADPMTSGPSAQLAIATQQGRVAELAGRHRRLKEGLDKVLDERGVDVVRRTRRGSGDNATETEEVRVDPGVVALAGELLDHEKQAAQELGQWESGGSPVVNILVVAPAPAAGAHPEDAVVEINIGGKR